MKKSSLLLLSVLALPVYADDLMKALLDHQPTRRSSASASTTSAPKKMASSDIKTVVSGKSCLDLDITEQKSLPLKVINSLIQEEPRKLNISHNPMTGKLEISSPPMIGNCNNMIDWKVQQTALNGENAYTIEAKFKQNDELCKDGKCKYKIWKQKKKKEKVAEEVAFSPNMKGFLECLEYSGAFKKGQDGPDAEAIYYDPISVEAVDIKQKGELVFISEGPQSSQIGPAAGDKFKIVNDCKYIEPVDSEPTILLSQEDVERARLDREAEELKKCTVNEYHRVADFLNDYEDDYGFLKDVRDKLIKEAAVKSATAILEGKETEEDWKVFEDFQKFILDPLYAEADKLYEEIEELSGDEKSRKMADLKKVLAQLAAYGNKPFFAQPHTDKLMADGKFDAAEKMNTVRLTIGEYQNLGKVKDGVAISPDVIINNVAQARQQYSEFIEKNRESYEIRTGQVTGKSQMYSDLANSMRRNIQVRTRNYMEEIQEENKRIQPGGYCYAYFRNTQKCIANSIERIQRLQFVLQRNNKVDQERAAEYDQKAAEYRALEAQGKRYVAAQNGEAVPEEDDTNVTPPERTDESSYTFNYNPQQGMQQPMMPGMQPPMMPGMQQPGMQGYMPMQMGPMGMNPMNPYGQQNMFMNQNPFMYQQPFMGQMGAFAQFGMQGNMGMNGMGGMNTFGMSPYMGMQQPMMGGQSYGFNYGPQMGQMGPGMMGPGGYGQPPMWGQPAMNNFGMF